MNAPTIKEATREVPVADRSDVVVVGGGPAGISAAVTAARCGASVTLLERYPYLGGLASGGMVLVLDDMHNDTEITVTGICLEMIERMKMKGLCVTPEDHERMPDMRDKPEMWRKYARWGLFDFHTQKMPHPICFSASFDPDGFKRATYDLIDEAKVKLRLHSWFSSAIVEDGQIKGVICDTKEGRQAILGDVVIDATGDLDVAASAGAKFQEASFILTTVSRWGNVDTDRAEAFQFDEPERFQKLDHEAKRIIGGCWAYWWLKTPLPGVVWLNCPHMPQYSGLKVAAGKLTGVSLRRDVLAMADCGASPAMIFTDFGVVTTDEQNAVPAAHSLLANLVESEPDVIVLEMGDGLLGTYGVHTLLADRGLRAALSAIVLCASDPVGAWGAAEILSQRFALSPTVISGPVTDTPVGRRYCTESLGVPAHNALLDARSLAAAAPPPPPASRSPPSGSPA